MDSSKNSVMIQFAVHTEELAEQIKKEVSSSGYKTTTKYLNDLLKRLFSMRKLFGEKSHLKELSHWIDFLEGLPIDEIRGEAKMRNCSCVQVLGQLIEESLQAARLRFRMMYTPTYQNPSQERNERRKQSFISHQDE